MDDWNLFLFLNPKLSSMMQELEMQMAKRVPCVTGRSKNQLYLWQKIAF